jgi:hypothetical protein
MNRDSREVERLALAAGSGTPNKAKHIGTEPGAESRELDSAVPAGPLEGDMSAAFRGRARVSTLLLAKAMSSLVSAACNKERVPCSLTTPATDRLVARYLRRCNVAASGQYSDIIQHSSAVRTRWMIFSSWGTSTTAHLSVTGA